ncbi:hypothetical protein [Porphyromonas levii]|uniref:hypothetical protein n=1 Tax=Porphyromonas levii TaxID=28114 RepID=UPI001BA8E10C|nr:hypothetical protein [Porphyromonas levii]MBR8702582.1 hypothetical protein [Porphyromonas levii]MBR8784387.1 hypothetical protein [Porphyromonas levii]
MKKRDGIILRRWLLLMILVPTLYACNKQCEEVEPEDYDTLFPFTGIEAPEQMNGNIVVRPCDPDLALEAYTYPGEEDNLSGEEYTITMSCSFEESDRDGSRAKKPQSKYVVSYINEHKQLVQVVCDKGEDSKNNTNAPKMKNFDEYRVTFKVRSGFPLYLSVTGSGPRNSHVEAKIEAVSKDEVVEVLPLAVHLYQNEEGIYRLKNPYCEFMILP